MARVKLALASDFNAPYMGLASLDSAPGGTGRANFATAQSLGLPNSAEVLTFRSSPTAARQLFFCATTPMQVWQRTQSTDGWGPVSKAL